MTTRRFVACGALAAALTASGGTWDREARAAPKKGHSASDRSELEPPDGARADGMISAHVSGRTSSRGVLVIRLRGLAPHDEYDLLCDDPRTEDPTPQKFAVVEARRNGRAALRFDTAHGDVLPFGASVDALSDARFEVRDAGGAVVLSGDMPDPHGVGPQADGPCRFTETIVLSSNFDLDVAGAAPFGWDLSGGGVVVADPLVKEGTTGLSASIVDADPVFGAPQMSHSFAPQSGFATVEFTLISPAAPGRVVFRIGKDSGGGTDFATGLGGGLGFYENGSIGLGAAEPLVAYGANTAYRFRVDFDFAAQTFDVAIAGTTLVTGRPLGLAGGTADRIAFGGAASTTGTANVDGVVVIERTQDCPPVLTVTGLPVSLWPPNHKLHTISPVVTATDDSGVDPVVTLEISSNESDEGTGDGNTTGDFVIRSVSDFDLRAERSGPGSGRTYHLVWTATDASGNETKFAADIRVPHDMGHGKRRR